MTDDSDITNSARGRVRFRRPSDKREVGGSNPPGPTIIPIHPGWYPQLRANPDGLRSEVREFLNNSEG